MPRRSANALSTPTFPRKPSARLPAPKRLRDLPGGAALWDEIVAAKPADYYQPDAAPQLEDYVRSVIARRVIGEQIAAASTPEALAARGGLNRLDWLLKLEERQVRLALTIATKLRITNQSRLSARAAANAAQQVGKRKPWEVEE